MKPSRGKRKKRTTRNERRWCEIEKITGPLDDLPTFFKHGLYHLRNRSSLADSELVRAFERCRAWLARAKKDGAGSCECGCGTRMAVEAVNAKGQSVWCLDHDKRNRQFRGLLFWRCNLEIGDGDRERKMAHASYALAHEARLPEETAFVRDRDEFQATGAVD